MKKSLFLMVIATLAVTLALQSHRPNERTGKRVGAVINSKADDPHGQSASFMTLPIFINYERKIVSKSLGLCVQ